MKKPPHVPSWDEGPAPEGVHELLAAGRHDDPLAGYDFDAGLARHLEQVRSGAPLPQWARELMQTGAAGAAGAGASLGSKGASAGGMKLLPFVLVPLVSAGLVTVAMTTAPGRDASVPNVTLAPSEQVAPSAQAIEHDALPGSAMQAPLAAEALPEPGSAAEPTAAPATDSRAAQARQERSQERGRDALRAIKRDAATRRGGTQGEAAQSIGGAQSASPEGLVDLTGAAASKGGVAASATANIQANTAARSELTQPDGPQQSEPAQARPQAQGEVAPKPPDVIEDDRLEREMAMLAMAQRVLASDPERALRLAQQGEQEFKGSMFTQERQQVLLLALIGLGRTDEAKRLAKPYLKSYPNGPFSDRLRRALVTSATAPRTE